MHTLKHLFRQCRFEYHSLVAREPALALLHRPNIWWQQYKIYRYYRQYGGHPRECVVGRHTELVIDGFQGSANSFAAAAFKHVQTRPVMVAHHLHSPAQIIKAVKLDLPTLVTIREPLDAVVSLTSRWPHISLAQALRSYIGFYEKIEPWSKGYVLSSFDMTTRHLDEVIAAVNHRFGTTFDPFLHTADNMYVLRGPEAVSPEEDMHRKAIKTQKRKELLEKHGLLLERATTVYQRMVAAPSCRSLVENHQSTKNEGTLPEHK